MVTWGARARGRVCSACFLACLIPLRRTLPSSYVPDKSACILSFAPQNAKFQLKKKSILISSKYKSKTLFYEGDI